MSFCKCHDDLQFERQSQEDYSGVIQKISPEWRLIMGHAFGYPEVELQFRDGGEWITYMKDSLDDLCLDLPEDLGMEVQKPTSHLMLVR